MRVIIIDTEATDADPRTAQVIELAAMQMPEEARHISVVDPDSLLKVVSRYRSSIPIKFGALATHHILPADLDSFPLFDAATEPTIKDIDYVIGHNVDFDADIVGGMAGTRRICTLAMARFLLPELDSHKQGAVLYYFALRGGWANEARRLQKEAHSAYADVAMCNIVFQGLLDIAERSGYNVSTWEDIWQLSELARIPTVMGFGKYKGTPISQMDRGYVQWYRRQPDTDPFYLEAFRRAGF